MRPAWIEIRKDSLKKNIKSLKGCTEDHVELMGVIKADAYGHGALGVFEVLAEVGVNRFAVVMVEEGIQLREYGVNNPILILGHSPLEDYEDIIDYELTPVIYKITQAEKLNEVAIRKNMKANIHIKIDTGMGRLGFLPIPESVDDIESISKLTNIRIEGIYSHLATADDIDNPFVYSQLKDFNYVLGELEKRGVIIPLRHLANSAATINYKETHFDMVRPGTSIYGLYPSLKMKLNPTVKLEPAMSIKAKLVHIKKINKGDSLSYGRTFIAKRDSIIGVVPLGYVDGVFRKLANKGSVLVAGKRCPIVGTICMDQLMIDLTDLGNVEAGDEVVILGRQGNEVISAEEIGELADTISIEVVTRLGNRMPIFYV